MFFLYYANSLLTVIGHQFPHPPHAISRRFPPLSTYGELAKANAALAKAAETASHCAKDKHLASNLPDLKTKHFRIEATEDYCTALLHDVRFLLGIADPVNTL
jgi:hypothetical protein